MEVRAFMIDDDYVNVSTENEISNPAYPTLYNSARYLNCNCTNKLTFKRSGTPYESRKRVCNDHDSNSVGHGIRWESMEVRAY